jgi:hypothetical protein
MSETKSRTHTEFQSENPNGRRNSRDLGADDRVVLNKKFWEELTNRLVSFDTTRTA